MVASALARARVGGLTALVPGLPGSASVSLTALRTHTRGAGPGAATWRPPGKGAGCELPPAGSPHPQPAEFRDLPASELRGGQQEV